MVAPMANAGVVVGADGLIIEVHPRPHEALCDGAQALLPEEFKQVAVEANALRKALQPEPNVVNA